MIEPVEAPLLAPGQEAGLDPGLSAVELAEAPVPEPGLELAVELVDQPGFDGDLAGGARQIGPVESVETYEGNATEGPVGEPSDQGDYYTWRDGDRTLRARLQLDLVVLDSGEIVSSADVVADTESGGRNAAAVESEGGDGDHPVFRSESGALMTLPGEVLLALDPEWSTDETDAFFVRNDIAFTRVSELGWLANGFFVETDPGLASLDLANTLAELDGVELSSPNWWREHTTR